LPSYDHTRRPNQYRWPSPRQEGRVYTISSIAPSEEQARRATSPPPSRRSSPSEEVEDEQEDRVRSIPAVVQAFRCSRGRMVVGLTVEYPTTVTGMSATTSTAPHEVQTATSHQRDGPRSVPPPCAAVLRRGSILVPGHRRAWVLILPTPSRRGSRARAPRTLNQTAPTPPADSGWIRALG
jgi:hypothetical protein